MIPLDDIYGDDGVSTMHLGERDVLAKKESRAMAIACVMMLHKWKRRRRGERIKQSTGRRTDR
jgi:hypothetical protein